MYIVLQKLCTVFCCSLLGGEPFSLNGIWFLYHTFLLLLYLSTQSPLYNVPHSPIHTHSFIQAHFPHLGAFCLTFTHIHTPMNTLESDLGFGILPGNNLAFRLTEQWMKPTTFQLIDGLLYLLSNSHLLQPLVVVCTTQEEIIHLSVYREQYLHRKWTA